MAKTTKFAISAMALLLVTTSAFAERVTVGYYLGDKFGDYATNCVDNYYNDVTSSPVVFTVTNVPMGWKVGDWRTGKSATIQLGLSQLTETGVTGASYTWIDYAMKKNALVVRFVPVVYNLQFNANGGEAFASMGPFLSTNETSLAEYTGTKKGHGFVGWTNEFVTTAFDHTESFVGVDKFGLGNTDTNVTLYAAWTANVYAVTFKFRNEKGQWTNIVKNVEYGNDAVPPSDDEVNIWPGHRFAGWEGGEAAYSSVTKDITVTANDYKDCYYSVEFDANCDDATGTMVTMEAKYGTQYNLNPNQFRRSGYLFDKWTANPDGTGTEYADGAAFINLTTEDGGIVTLHAQWRKIKYSIEFDGNGGEGAMSSIVNVHSGESIVLTSNKFVKTGWKFKDWGQLDDFGAIVTNFADGATVSDLATNDMATVTLVAQWAPIEYAVRFVANGGEGEMPDEQFKYGEAKPLSSNAFARTGHAFLHWTAVVDSVATNFADGAVVSDLTTEDGATILLEAEWKPVAYNVAFAGGDGVEGGMASISNVSYGQDIKLTPNGFSKEGWVFKEWEFVDDTNATNHFADAATVSNLTTNDGATVTLVAQWMPAFQAAMHCEDLAWEGVELPSALPTDNNKWAARFEEGIGYNGSGSCAEQAGFAGNVLMAEITTNGMLTFMSRNASEGVAKLYLTATVKGPENVEIGDIVKADLMELDYNDGWQSVSYEINDADFIESVTTNFPGLPEQEIVTNRQNSIYIYIFVMSSVGTVQIDQMKWTPEGSGDEPVDPDEPADPGAVVEGYSGKYDGTAHGISVDVTNVVGAVVTRRFATAADGEFGDVAPEFTDVGTNMVWCEVSAPGYATVTNSADVVILPREVTLTSGSAEKEYDGTPVLCADIYVGSDGFADGEGATFDVTGSQTDVGESANTFTYELNGGTKAGNYDIATSNGTLVVTKATVGPGDGSEPGEGEVPAGGASKFDASAIYDGHGHVIDTNALVAAFDAAMFGGAEVAYAIDSGANAPVLPWLAAAPSFTNVGEHVVWYRAANQNYEDFIHTAKVVIVKREVSLTSGSAEKEYDGEPLTCETVETGGDGFVDGEGATFNVTGSQTDVGESANTFTYELNDGTRAENYNVTTNCGTLKVTKGEDPEPPPAPPVVAGEGTVTIPKRWKANQKVTWKAKAAKGSVFAHWEGDFVESLELSANELRSPSLQFVADEASGDFDTNRIQAVFIALDSDKLSTLSLSSFEPLALNEKVAEFVLQDDSESYVTATVSGLPSGLKFDKKTLAITGTPKKSGAFIVKITAKNASGYQWAENVVLKVKNADGTVPPDPAVVPVPKRTMYHPLTVMSSDVADGTVTGTGVYAAGKKVSISARAAKEHVFAGWYRDKELTEPMEFASGDYLKSPQSVVIPEARYLYAWFVTTVQDRDSIKFFVNDEECLTTAMPPVSNWCGVAVNWPIEATALSATTVKASGLPAGVKLVQDKTTKAYSLSGAPTSASRKDKYGDLTPSKVKLTVTTAGKSSKVYEFNWTIMPLPTWTVGTFNGAVFGEDNSPTGLVQALTVAANGKISGKVLYDGLTWTLAAPCFDGLDSLENPAFHATVVAKSGKLVATNAIEIAVDDSVDFERGVVAGTFNGQLTTHNSQLTTYTWTAYQNLWKANLWKTTAKPFSRAPALKTADGVSLKFATSGAVTAKGVFKSYSASCSTVLIPNDDETYSVYLHFPMKSGKFDGYSAEVGLLWNGTKFSEE